MPSDLQRSMRCLRSSSTSHAVAGEAARRGGPSPFCAWLQAQAKRITNMVATRTPTPHTPDTAILRDPVQVNPPPFARGDRAATTGLHTPTTGSSPARSAHRGIDPDAREMRDHDTVLAAIQAAETGRLMEDGPSSRLSRPPACSRGAHPRAANATPLSGYALAMTRKPEQPGAAKATQEGAPSFTWTDLPPSPSAEHKRPVGIRKEMHAILTKAGEAGVLTQGFSHLEWRDSFSKDKLYTAMGLLVGETGLTLQYQKRAEDALPFRWRIKP